LIRSAYKTVRPPQNVPVVTLSSYDMRAPILAAFPPKGQIVMVGDSLTEFAPWNGMFPNEEIANYGISGDTVEGYRAGDMRAPLLPAGKHYKEKLSIHRLRLYWLVCDLGWHL
jgi:hypothetical protein